MSTDQVDNGLPPGERQAALPVQNYIQDYRPMVPTGEAELTSQRLQHIYVTNGSPASFGLVVSKQWREDRSNGRTTWAVVGTALEVELLQEDLISGAATDVPGESIDAQLVAAPPRQEAISGRGIVIVTFEHLVTFLTRCLQEDRTWQWDASCGSPTVVMNFGWGNMSFEMAFACPLVARLIEDTIQACPQVMMACTVSSDDRPYFGRSWQDVQMQEITVLTGGSSTRPNFCLDKDMADNSIDSILKIETLLSEISNNNARVEGQRSLLLIDPGHKNELASWGQEILFAYGVEPLRGNDAGDIALDSKTSYTGQVSRIDDVIIHPHADTFSLDQGQIARGKAYLGISRSQAEVNYLSRCNQESHTPPQVHIMMKEEHFRLLPAHCKSSPAHTLHLARLLVCSRFIWPDVPLAEVPVLLTEDRDDVFQQLEHLSAKGLMEKWHDPSLKKADRERDSERYESMTLTPLGCNTAAILMKGVRSLHSAHLLAQLLDTEQQNRALNKTIRPVVEAVLALSVLTEVTVSDVTPLLRYIVVEDWSHDDRAWYDHNFRGISEQKAGRGPLWQAVGLWHLLMNDVSLRAMRRPPYPIVQLSGDNISINVGVAIHWDRRLFKFSNICTTLSDMDKVDGLGDFPLTDEQFLAVEVALVRAFMDRVMVVEFQEEVNTKGSTVWKYRAWDLASDQYLGLPPLPQNFQIWWDDCHRIDETAGGEKSPVIFCVYSYLLYDIIPVGDGSFTLARAPLDATYVSARAVQLAFEGTEAHAKVSDPSSYLRRLREDEGQGGPK